MIQEIKSNVKSGAKDLLGWSDEEKERTLNRLAGVESGYQTRGKYKRKWQNFKYRIKPSNIFHQDRNTRDIKARDDAETAASLASMMGKDARKTRIIANAVGAGSNIIRTAKALQSKHYSDHVINQVSVQHMPSVKANTPPKPKRKRKPRKVKADIEVNSMNQAPTFRSRMRNITSNVGTLIQSGVRGAKVSDDIVSSGTRYMS